MNKTPIIQICFSLKTGLTTENIKTKLTELKNKLNDIYGNNVYDLGEYTYKNSRFHLVSFPTKKSLA